MALSACGGPVRAIRVDRTVANRDLTRNIVTTGELSWTTRDVLFERGLFEGFAERPDVAIEALHRAMVDAGGDPDMLFALAELSAFYGEASRRREYELAAAVYAYAFLFPEHASHPGPFDPRFRVAADLYNWSLAAAFASKDGAEVVPRGGTFALPFGEIAVAFDPAELRAGDRILHRFIPVPSSQVEGWRCGIAGRYQALRSRIHQARRGRAPGRDMVARGSRCR